MLKASTKFKKAQKVTVGEKEIRNLFTLSSRLADITEHILEERGDYSEEFLKGLHQSLKEARIGKKFKINSLRGLR